MYFLVYKVKIYSVLFILILVKNNNFKIDREIDRFVVIVVMLKDSFEIIKVWVSDFLENVGEMNMGDRIREIIYNEVLSD